jgi:hypothetical protein
VPAMPILWFGMAVYCIRYDPSSFGSKIVWFFLFLLLGPAASAAYFFRVYRQQIDTPPIVEGSLRSA